ncbi:hypothetical protein Avbf_05301 [Armadillidium vulgare]|nr:hypothetical protein Avbf_05301 [Armadillidium vulgare]
MDANHFQDEILGVQSIGIETLEEDVPSHFTLEYPGGSRVFITMKLQKNKESDLRFSLSLCEEEKEFLRERRSNVMNCMQDMLGDRAPKHKNEVPVIAVLGSGGGFRAMTCFSAAVKALHQSDILGCSTYISGLSGSSWFISTLYAKDNFPDVTYEEIYEDLKKSVSQNWKWNLIHSYRYVLDMMDKSRKGQPVSFTDIFGHLLGDVLLKENKNKKLSDQRQIVFGGKVPLPLYTCLHAKASVSCRTFSEWIEFTPFEIGIAKYGTFMKPEYFGSKFLVGKLIKQFPELPLHYLQGVWGSAFTILMKRLAFDGGSKQDIVQMLRDVNEERAINERLEDEYLQSKNSDVPPAENESESDDDVDIEGADDKSSDDDENKGTRTLEEDIAAINELLGTQNPYCPKKQNSLDPTPVEEISEESEHDKPVLKNETVSPPNDNVPDKKVKKGFSFGFMKKSSLDLHGRENKDETSNRKISTQSDPGIISSPSTEMRRERLQRRGAVRETRNSSKTTSNYWEHKKKARKSQKERKPTIIQNWMKTSGLLNSRAGRAGEILNPFRGLSLRNSFPISPFTMSPDDEDDDDDVCNTLDIGLGCRYKPLDNTAKKLFIVDSGLAFNSPFPLLLRPQRAVDMYLSFDFSQRPSDNHMPFKELLLAEKWAVQNQVPFPPIEKLNIFFIRVRRETEEEIDFANFSLFDDPSQPYASTNFVYDPLQYDRLFKLIEFNTLSNIDKIKEEICECVEKKREIALKPAENIVRKMQNVMNALQKIPEVRKYELES